MVGRGLNQGGSQVGLWLDWAGSMVFSEKVELVWMNLDCGVPYEEILGGTKWRY